MTIPPTTQISMYRTMLTIRLFEERVTREFGRGDMPGFVHTYIGQEAVAAGVCADLGDDDYITSSHRGHGHCIAKGCSLRGMVAELYGRETGLCKGRGGSMHIADFKRGMLGANAIVGGGFGLATGGALAAQVRGSKQVAVCFFGDGAVNQGTFHESLNLAAIWKLPVIYVCENNGWAESTPTAYSTSGPSIAGRAAAYGIPSATVDASSVLEVYDVAHEAIARARAEVGPTLIEARTYRLTGHYVGDPEKYRDRQVKKALKDHDPIPAMRSHLIESGVATEADLDAVAAEIGQQLDDAVAYGKAQPLPDPADVEKYVYA